MKIKIKVKPNSLEQKIERISENEYFASLESSADKNKANIELLKLLKKYFKKEIRIVSGLTSRDKIIEVKEKCR